MRRTIFVLKMICLMKMTRFCFVASEFNAELNDLAAVVVSKYFSGFRCITYVTDEEKGEIGPTSGKPVIVINLASDKLFETEILTETFEQGCGGYVMRIEKRRRSGMIQSLLRARREAVGGRYNVQRYLFLPKDEKDVDLDVVRDPKIFFTPNLIAVIFDAGIPGFALVGHTAFDGHKSEVLGVSHEVLDVWTSADGFKFSNDLYPDRVKNVNGKKLIGATLQYSPFSLIIEEGNDTIFDGFETRIVIELAKIINATWEGLNHPVELWGVPYPNGTGTGIFGSVLEHKADVGFSGIYQWFCECLDCSRPLYQSEVACLVPRPDLLPGWLTVVLPLRPDTWAGLIVTYFLTSGFVLFLRIWLQYLSGTKTWSNIWMNLSDSFFTIFRIHLEQVPRIPKSKQPLAVYVNISVFYYFFVAAFWQGGIASNLTVPRYEERIDQTTDLIKRWPGIKWGANSDAWVNSIRASSDPHLVEIVKKFVVLDDGTLAKKTKTRDFGFFFERLPHGHYGIGDYIDEEAMKHLRSMEGHIYSAFGVLVLPKGSPYTERFDRSISWMYDTGLIRKIGDQVQVTLDRINNRLENMIKLSNLKESGSDGVILAVRHIQGPLYIYIVGMSLAALVFFLEKFSFVSISRCKTH